MRKNGTKTVLKCSLEKFIESPISNAPESVYTMANDILIIHNNYMLDSHATIAINKIFVRCYLFLCVLINCPIFSI